MKTIKEKIDAIEDITDPIPSISEDNMGLNELSDFIDVPDNIDDDLEYMALHAVNARIGTCLNEYNGTRNEAWEAWCNEDVKADFSDIEAIIND